MSDDSLVVYEIPAENMAGLLAKLATLSRKSQRILGKPIDLSILGEVRTPAMTLRAGKLVPALDAEGNPSFNLSYKVTINAETPKIAGWTFIATIDHSAGSGNLLRITPNVVCDVPEKYRTIAPLCDHCGKIRSRRDTFLLRSDSTGEFKQIGRQCVRDFIGYDIERVVAMAEICSAAAPSGSDADYDGDFSHTMRDRRYIFVNTYLAHVAAVLRAHGWVGRKDVESTGQMSTAADAHMNMFRKPGGRPAFVPVPLTEKDFATADAALAWAAALRPRNNYEHNINVLAQETVIEGRSIGMLASIVPGYFQHVQREFERTRRQESLRLSDSKHIGSIGDKIGSGKQHALAPMDAVLYGFHSIDGNYGPTYIYRFLTVGGDVVVWFCSGASQGAEKLDLGGMDAANRVKVRIVGGTVKKHGTYQGVNQTVIGRCKIEIGAVA